MGLLATATTVSMRAPRPKLFATSSASRPLLHDAVAVPLPWLRKDGGLLRAACDAC
jgi:hypothetical protein